MKLDTKKCTPQEFVNYILDNYSNSDDTDNDNDDLERIAQEKCSRNKDGFYYVIEFNGSDRCGIEFLDKTYNLKKKKPVPCAGPWNCFIYQYDKIDQNKPGYLFYLNQDQQSYLLIELD